MLLPMASNLLKRDKRKQMLFFKNITPGQKKHLKLESGTNKSKSGSWTFTANRNSVLPFANLKWKESLLFIPRMERAEMKGDMVISKGNWALDIILKYNFNAN